MYKMSNPTQQTLIEQMRITDFEIENRKAIISLTNDDVLTLKSFKPTIDLYIEEIISCYYIQQTKIPEIALIIGDSGTLERLKAAQRRYVADLFSGIYDLEYVNNRCRIGLVHKRIGVEPKLYLSGILCLKEIIGTIIEENVTNHNESQKIWTAMDKLFMFDVTLVFETYIRSLVAEIESAKDKSDSYAVSLEDKVRERTQELNNLARYDALTGLLNTRQLHESLLTATRTAQRESTPISVVYIDVNDFKIVNDTEGHQRGDAILKTVGSAISSCARPEDFCFRYGGDEFLIILTSCSEKQARETYVMALEKRMAEAGVSLSIGVAQTGPHNFLDENALIKLADEDMYKAKKAHKERKAAAAGKTKVTAAKSEPESESKE